MGPGHLARHSKHGASDDLHDLTSHIPGDRLDLASNLERLTKETEIHIGWSLVPKSPVH